MGIFLSSNSVWSIDNTLFFSENETFIGFWNYWILEALLSIIYFHAGIAKLNGDWLKGEPLVHWLIQRKVS